MKQKIKSFFLAAFPAIFAAALFAAAFTWAWVEPSQSLPLGNVAAPLNVSSQGQIKKGNLILNTDGTLANGLIVASGNVGIGTTVPEAKLDVDGPMRLLPMAEPFACTAAKKGSLYFNSGTNKHMMCNGAAWGDYTGPQGPQGPKGNTGATGPQGPQGPVGPGNALSCTIKSTSFTIGPLAAQGVHLARCPSGYYATGGGFLTINTKDLLITESRPYSYAIQNDSWSCGAWNAGTVTRTYTCYAQCCKLISI